MAFKLFFMLKYPSNPTHFTPTPHSMALKSAHNCSIISLWRKITLVAGALLYSLDTALDMRVARYMYKEGDPIWGILLLTISFLSLVITNGASHSKRLDRTFHYLPTREDRAWSVNASNKSPVRRYFCPWRWDSAFHAALNIISALQLNPVIDALEVIFHAKQSFRSITLKYAHYKATRKLDRIFESSLVVSIQTISLVRFLSKETTPEEEEEEEEKLKYYFQLCTRVSSLLFSCISLAYIVATEERARRFAELHEYDMMIGCGVQTAVLFLGYFTVYCSRVLLVSIVYYCFRANQVNFFTVITVELHHWFIISIYLIYVLKSNTFDGIVVAKRRPLWVLVPIFYIVSVTEIFIVNLRFPVRSVGLALHRNSDQALGHRSCVVFGALYLLFGVELLAVLVVTHIPGRDLPLITQACLYGSTALYLTSAGLFYLYFHPAVNPDARREKHPHKTYMTALVPLTCDMPLKNLPPKQAEIKERGHLPELFTEFLLGGESTFHGVDVNRSGSGDESGNSASDNSSYSRGSQASNHRGDCDSVGNDSDKLHNKDDCDSVRNDKSVGMEADENIQKVETISMSSIGIEEQENADSSSISMSSITVRI